MLEAIKCPMGSFFASHPYANNTLLFPVFEHSRTR